MLSKSVNLRKSIAEAKNASKGITADWDAEIKILKKDCNKNREIKKWVKMQECMSFLEQKLLNRDNE